MRRSRVRLPEAAPHRPRSEALSSLTTCLPDPDWQPNWQPSDTLATLARGWAWTIADATGEQLGAANGMTSHQTREVLISSERSPVQRVKTLAHELGHVIRHGEGCAYRANRGLLELEAESVAYVVCARLLVSTGAQDPEAEAASSRVGDSNTRTRDDLLGLSSRRQGTGTPPAGLDPARRAS